MLAVFWRTRRLARVGDNIWLCILMAIVLHKNGRARSGAWDFMDVAVDLRRLRPLSRLRRRIGRGR